MIAPRFCKLPRNCFLPAGNSINFFCRHTWNFGTRLYLNFREGQCHERSTHEFLKNCWSYCDDAPFLTPCFFFFAMVCDGVERIVIAAQCFFIPAWCEFKQTRTNGRSNLRWLCEGGRMFVRLGVRVGLWSGCRVMCSEWLWKWRGNGDTAYTVWIQNVFVVHFIRFRMCRHTWTISKANTAAFTCTSHTNVQTNLLKFLTSTVKDTCHAHTLTHNSYFHFFFRFVLRLRPFRIYVCLCQSGIEYVCKFFGVELSSAMKVSAWTCKCATSGFEWDDFYGKALDHVLQDAVSTENQVDFTERHKIFVTEGQRAILKKWQTWSNVLIFMKGKLQNLRMDLRKNTWRKNNTSAELRGQWLEVFTSSKRKQNHVLLAFRSLIISSVIFDETWG